MTPMIYTSQHSHGFEKVLKLLKSHRTEYLSGQDLSDVLKISRVAVWKHIKKIRSLGYDIESRQNLGYRLVDTTDRLYPWEICDGLKTRTVGKTAYYFDTIDSTQTFALEISGKKNKDGVIVVAGRQTRGRGRMDRKWASPKGGIWMSIVLQPESDMVSTLIPLAASVALAAAIKETTGAKASLKWPNDLLIGKKKAAGILVDASITAGRMDYIIIGVGINFDVQARDVEKKIKKTGNYTGVASLRDSARDARPVLLVQSFLAELEGAIDALKSGDEKKIIKRWTRNSSTIGSSITVRDGAKKITGTAVRVDPDGALVIRQKNGLRRILSGDASQ